MRVITVMLAEEYWSRGEPGSLRLSHPQVIGRASHHDVNGLPLEHSAAGALMHGLLRSHRAVR
jgi:hypothetical protein